MSKGKTLYIFLPLILFQLPRDDKRLTTAPIRERPKYSEMYKTNNLELPMIRGKNGWGREPVVASRDFKRAQMGKKEDNGKIEHDYE